MLASVITAFRDELIHEDKSSATVRNYSNDVELFAAWVEKTSPLSGSRASLMFRSSPR